jgi:acyl-CoA synthetase (AMP-forming)/AMP-acid ligase II
MSGYYRNTEETAKTLRDGFVHTGDIGFIDADGCLHIVDRKKDMVITGGFNVYPAEVELVIRRRADIVDCAVIGVPDEYWGEVVVAAVQVADGVDLDTAELTADLRNDLGAVKTPKHIVVVDELPVSGVGKVLRTEVRAIIVAQLVANSGSGDDTGSQTR